MILRLENSRKVPETTKTETTKTETTKPETTKADKWVQKNCKIWDQYKEINCIST